MQINSKYMKAYVEKKENRIRREIVAAVFLAFRNKGYSVSVSHDSTNETEVKVNNIKACLKAVFDSEYNNNCCWIFAAGHSGIKSLWVMLVLDNVEDIVSDYHTEAEKLLTAANEIARKYD